MKIVAIPCIIAVPSILIVAPNGTVNDEIFFLLSNYFPHYLVL